jgi:hypothetical protein
MDEYQGEHDFTYCSSVHATTYSYEKWPCLDKVM